MIDPELKDRLTRLDQGLTEIRRLITGNGSVGIAEQGRNAEKRAERCADQLAEHMDMHQGWLSLWIGRGVYLVVTLAAVALTAWFN